MVLSRHLTRRRIAYFSIVVAAVAGLALFLALRRPPRVDMARYVPSGTLAFIEVDNLTDLVSDLTDTKAWRELAPALGVSSQLGQIGIAADLMSRTGVGPDEAVLASRAQVAVALTGIEAQTGMNEEGPYIHFKPQFALVAETHSNPQSAARIVGERASILAARIYGDSITERAEVYYGARLLAYHGADPDRQLVAASTGSLVLIGNHVSSVKACLDAIGGRTAVLAEDETLKGLRPTIDRSASVFAFVTQAGIEKLVEFGPAIFASRFTTDPDRISSMANLFGHLSRQTTAGLFYSAAFDSGLVVERYLTVLRPQVAEALAGALKPAPAAFFDMLELAPRRVEDFSAISVEGGAGELPERVLRQMAPQLDLVAGVALREFVINFREQLGLEANESLGDALGNDLLLVRFDQSQPVVMVARANDRARLSPTLARYLARGGAQVSAREHNGIEISVSSNEDGRAAAFVEGFLILGTFDQIAAMIEARSGGQALADDERLSRALATRPPGASFVSYRPDADSAADMMLAIARLTRVSDGSREQLEQPEVRRAIERMPPSVSFTEFRDYGIYTETRSAVGSFSLISSLVGGDEGP
ncbi:MAG TPA: hypothetical protein VFQ92_20380 [Blastocatellia bacterium]|nr:hypothetical protein [Blastocatellia bacterium]